MNGASANVVKRQRVTLRKEIRDGVVSFVDIFSAKEVDLLKKDHAGLLHNDDDGYDDDLKANGVDVFWEPLDSDDEYDSDDEVDSSDSDDSGTEDEGEDNADSFDEVDYANVSEDIQFLAGKAVDEENPGYKGPSTSSGDWDRRNVAREAFIKETREVESQMKTMLSSFRANSDMSPECFYCGRAALTICHDCSANGRYACQEHFCMTISQSTVHNVSEEDAGGGLKPTIVPVRSWRCENCSFCLASFFRYPPDDTSSYTVSVHTSRSGVVKVCVTAQRCSQCDCISGESASEFGCTPGAKYVWFTNDFMHANRRMYVANGFRVSTYAQFKAKLDADADRGSFNGSSAVYQSFSAASRIFTALLDDLRSLSTRGGNAPPIENLGSCPACANGYHSVNGDACMKLRVASRNAKSAALPLPTHDNFFGPNALTDHGKVLDLTMEAMRNCLKKRESSPATENGYSGPQPLPPLLSSGLCSSNFRAAQGEPTSSAKSATENKRLKAYAITGVFAATCGHGMAIKPSCRMIDTPGERYEFTQLTIECMYHLCGLVPNPKVFGPVPSGTKTRPPRFLISDLACKMHPRLKKQSPWVLEFTDLALGNVHGKLSSCCKSFTRCIFNSFFFNNCLRVCASSMSENVFSSGQTWKW